MVLKTDTIPKYRIFYLEIPGEVFERHPELSVGIEGQAQLPSCLLRNIVPLRGPEKEQTYLGTLSWAPLLY